MTITEQTLVPKNPAKRSEDGIVVTADFVAVIDGSTSKSRRRCHRDLSLRRRSNGELAMSIVAAVVRRLPRDASCHQFCLEATRAVHRRYRKALLPHLDGHPEDRLAASAVVFSRLRRELWLVGDCQCLVDGQLYDNPKPHEAILAAERATLIRQGMDADAARQAIIPHMLQFMQQQNRDYAVIDGFPIPQRHVRRLPLDFQPHELVLASDGYPFLCPTLAESEARLERQRRQDPLNTGPDFQATKAFLPGSNSFDDRAYIRFNI